jgi:DNA-binding PadR family transcriptional regulator
MTLSNYLSKIRAYASRGLSRRYILELLIRQPRTITSKEIIDKVAEHNGDRRRPTPGLIYPILGKLLNEGLIEQSSDGRYAITRKGLDLVADLHSSARKILGKQMNLLFRTGKVGRFMAMDLIERAYVIGSILNSNLDRMTEEERDKYREFLQNELKKLDYEETKKKQRK